LPATNFSLMVVSLPFEVLLLGYNILQELIGRLSGRKSMSPMLQLAGNESDGLWPGLMETSPRSIQVMGTGAISSRDTLSTCRQKSFGAVATGWRKSARRRSTRSLSNSWSRDEHDPSDRAARPSGSCRGSCWPVQLSRRHWPLPSRSDQTGTKKLAPCREADSERSSRATGEGDQDEEQFTIDLVSDVSCPWCVIGLRNFQTGLSRLADTVDADIVFRPSELNPTMQPEGQNLVEHIAQKYGSTREQSAASRAMIRDRAAAVGFTTVSITDDDSRIYNTFDAHRLLHWAKTQGVQQALKEALFELYFTNRGDPSNHEALVLVATAVGLDPMEAQAILSTDRYVDDVRNEEKLWRSRGISSVPAFVIGERYLISGGQPLEVFERVLREIAAEGKGVTVKAGR
jgi:predicted DsbA family dithiol-disulfide isomerase